MPFTRETASLYAKPAKHKLHLSAQSSLPSETRHFDALTHNLYFCAYSGLQNTLKYIKLIYVVGSSKSKPVHSRYSRPSQAWRTAKPIRIISAVSNWFRRRTSHELNNEFNSVHVNYGVWSGPADFTAHANAYWTFQLEPHPPPELWRFLLVKSMETHSKVVLCMTGQICKEQIAWISWYRLKIIYKIKSQNLESIQITSISGHMKTLYRALETAGNKKQQGMISITTPSASLREFQNVHMSWSKDHRHHH